MHLAAKTACQANRHLVKPIVIKNDRWSESLFGAASPLLCLGNPARETNRRNRWQGERFRRLVSLSKAAPGQW
jgi:hypothetical protein